MATIFFIPHNVPSSKNSKQLIPIGKGAKKRMIPIWSATALKYVKDTKKYFEALGTEFKKIIVNKQKPYVIGFHYVRGSRHKFDEPNPKQTLLDLMTKYGWIEDDNMDEIIPIPFKKDEVWYSYNKETPGVYIKVYDDESNLCK